MNQYTLMEAIGMTDEAFLSAAERSMHSPTQDKRHLPFRLILVAATLALLLAAIFIPIAIGRNPVDTPAITTPTTDKVYAGLTDIPGATKLESYDNINTEDKSFGPIFRFDSERWIENIKANYSIFIGKLIDVEAVFFDEGDKRYILSVMTYQVYEGICNFEETETVKAVYISEYERKIELDNSVTYQVESTYSPYDGVTVKKDMLYDSLLFTEYVVNWNQTDPRYMVLGILEPSENKTYTIDDIAYDLSAYAPYFFNATLFYQNGSDLASMRACRFNQTLCVTDLLENPHGSDYRGPEPDMTPIDRSFWPQINIMSQGGSNGYVTEDS